MRKAVKSLEFNLLLNEATRASKFGIPFDEFGCTLRLRRASVCHGVSWIHIGS